MRRLFALLAVLALVPFALAACGDDDSSSSSDTSASTSTSSEDTAGTEKGGGGTVSVSAVADGSLAFEESELTASAGSNSFEFTNPASTPHDFCIESDGSEVGCTDTISGSDTATLDEDLDAGDYTFYCSVPGHRDAGMEGTLTVD